MSTATTAYYSKKTGNRVGTKYGTRNPNLVESFVFVEGTVALEFLDRGCSIPTTLTKARAADEARKAAAAAATAAEAAKKAKKAAKKVPVKKTAKKAAAKKTSRIVKRDLADGHFAKKTSAKKSVVTDVVKAPTKKRAVKVKPASQTGLVNKK